MAGPSKQQRCTRHDRRRSNPADLFGLSKQGQGLPSRWFALQDVRPGVLPEVRNWEAPKSWTSQACRIKSPLELIPRVAVRVPPFFDQRLRDPVPARDE